MEAIKKIDANYLEFLDLVQDISQKSLSIQRNLIMTINDNFDIHKFKAKLDKEVAFFDKLLTK